MFPTGKTPFPVLFALSLVMSMIEPGIQKQAIDDALEGRICSRHKMAAEARIERKKLVLHFCCKEFSQELSPLITLANQQLFERYKGADFDRGRG